MKKAIIAAVSSLLLYKTTAEIADTTLLYNITENKEPVPAKITIFGDAGTPDPNFGVKQKLYREYGHKNAVFSYTGKGSISLPSGSYTLLISRGIEYEPSKVSIVMNGGELRKIDVELEKALDTTGYVSGDFHVHANPSTDSNVKLTDRVITAATEGVEYIVGTDHNKKTDYTPIIKSLGLEKFLVSSIGDEITTANLGHINAFPLDPAMPLIGYTPDMATLIKEVKKDKNNPIIQINHPRFGPLRLKGTKIGTPYSTFQIFRFDEHTRTEDKLYSPEYEALEVFNGVACPPIEGLCKFNENEKALRDYFNLLNRGYRYTATANSDSHSIIPEVGYPRNFIYVEDDSITPALETRIINAVRAHKVVLTNGPLIDLTYKGKNALGLEIRKEAMIKIKVTSIESIKPEFLDVIANGKRIMHFPLKGTFEKELLLSPKRDTWYIFMAYGGKFTIPLSKILAMKAPFAMANPVWIDANGDGKFTPLEKP